MRILIVEDEPDSVRALECALDEMSLELDMTVVGARDAACAVLGGEAEFDFVVCDLHIPAAEGGEPALEHGLAVYEFVTRELPGTPTMLLTGSGDVRPARERISTRPAVDIFGVGTPYPMTDLIYKNEPEVFAQRIADVATQMQVLDSIEIVSRSGDLDLSASQGRVLRIFARRHGARRVEVLPLGGLSDAVAVRATLFTEGRRFIAAVFAKLGLLTDVDVEAERYQAAALRLPAGSYAPLLDRVSAGARHYGGLFYGLADRHQDVLFNYIFDHPDEAVRVVEDLRDVLSAWRGQRLASEQTLVTTLRRDRVGASDIESFLPSMGDEWREFEKQKVPMVRALQHGDLHGGNVLVGDSTIPLLIDFANVEELPAGFDPLVLELSLVFHPDSPFRDHPWPSVEQCERWDDLDAYTWDCPAGDLVRTCRAWALRETAPVSMYALAYAEALRQLAYVSEESERATAIARAAARRGLQLALASERDERKER